jgi:hypothetical protein
MDASVRFWSKTKREGECIVWAAHKWPSGYGAFGWRGKVRRAHRVAYEITHGPFAESLCVLHKCDNPSCVNPAHLFLGTHADNMKDASQKGRINAAPAIAAAARAPRPTGERHHAAKLTSADVLAMRQAKASGATISELIEKYSVSYAAAYDIVIGNTWVAVGGPLHKKRWSRKA